MIQDGVEESSGKGGHSPGAQRKTYWRSASWSSRDSLLTTTEMSKSSFSGTTPSGLLTPRAQQSSKSRSSLPPLQPLFISRRSVDQWPKAGSDDLGEWPHPPTPRTNISNSIQDLGSGRQPEFLLRKDKLSFFEKECTQIADHIYLGSDAVAKNRELLQRNGITHVLNCVGFVCPEYFKKDLVYKTLWLQDNPSEDITSILYDVFDYFEDVRHQRGRVLVHCCQGVSRSTSLVIAYLMWRDGRSFDEAFEFVKSVRATVNPNVGFTCQLLQCQKRVHAAPLSPSSTLRMFRMAPHSPYDPLHLVPKFIANPGAMALDSRTAFIMRVPSSIYVWVGKHCHPVIAKDANFAAVQVIRYEKAEGPVIVVEEGNEMEDFWDALCGAPLPVKETRELKDGNNTTKTRLSAKDQVALVAKIGVGNKRVEAYDLDHEIFQKVVSSGVVPPIGDDTELPVRENGWGLLRQKLSDGYAKELIVATRTTKCGDPYVKSPTIQDSNSCNVDGSLATFDPSRVPSPTLSPGSVLSDSYTSLNSSSLSPSDLSSSSTPSLASASAWSDFTFIPSRSPSPTAPPDNALPIKKLLDPAAKAFPSSEGHPLSLAQRRGNMSLMLSSLVHPPQATVVRSRSVSLPLSDERKYSNSLGTKSHSHDHTNMKHRVEVTAMPERERQVENLISEELNLKLNILETSVAYCSRPSETDALGNGQIFPTPDITGAVSTDFAKSALFRWPDLQRVVVPGTVPLDSTSVFLLPTYSSNQGELKVLYVWVGGSVELHQCDRVNSNVNVNLEERLYWERFAREFLKRMNLPADMHIQVIRENDQPKEFEDYLKSVSSHHMVGDR